MTAPRRPRRVLFLSTRNAARSLIAEAWLRQVGGDNFEVGSAGTQPADEVDPMAIQVMREVGVDLSASRPRSSADLRGEDFDLVVVLRPRGGGSQPHIEGSAELAEWSFDDPSGEQDPDDNSRLRRYRRIRDELRTRVSLFVNATSDALMAPASRAGSGESTTTTSVPEATASAGESAHLAEDTGSPRTGTETDPRP